MTDLRAALIEAGAVALSKHHWPVRWDRPENIEACKVEARLVVDTFLGVLADRADEWADWNAAECADADDGCDCVSDVQVSGLIAVLRGDTE